MKAPSRVMEAVQPVGPPAPSMGWSWGRVGAEAQPCGPSSSLPIPSQEDSCPMPLRRKPLQRLTCSCSAPQCDKSPVTQWWRWDGRGGGLWSTGRPAAWVSGASKLLLLPLPLVPGSPQTGFPRRLRGFLTSHGSWERFQTHSH